MTRRKNVEDEDVQLIRALYAEYCDLCVEYKTLTILAIANKHRVTERQVDYVSRYIGEPRHELDRSIYADLKRRKTVIKQRSQLSIKCIASKFGLDSPTVSMIVKGKTYSKLPWDESILRRVEAAFPGQTENVKFAA